MRSRTLLAAISPCPNDTFCFQRWAEGAVDSSLRLSLSFHDIEMLNVLAQTTAPYDLTKVSTACLSRIEEKYVPLSSGAAFAMNGGPKVVAKTAYDIRDLRQVRVAVPGKNTSAFVAFSILYGKLENPIQMPSSEILNSVLRGDVDAGLVIHEGRFVYSCLGLHQIVDIGDAYFSRFHTPLPLGVIVARRSLGDEVLHQLSSTLQQSILQARSEEDLSPFVRSRATEIEVNTIWQHIHHFVTDETEQMSDAAYQWIEIFLREAKRAI